MAIITVTGREPKVSTSDGHGYETSGKETPNLPERDGKRMKEKEFNEAVQNYLNVELKRCGIKHKDVAPGRTDIPLKDRANASDAFDADLHIDIHANALNSKFDDKKGGIETYYIVTGNGKSKEVAKVLHRHLIGGSKLVDRGLKDGSWLYMLKHVNAVSALVELGFMDSKNDIDFLLSEDYRKECAVELAKGICEIFGKKYVPYVKPEEPAKPVEKPVTSEGTHTVVKGDTLWSISQKYHVAVAELEKLNPGVMAKALQIGDKLKVGATVKKEEPKKPVVLPKYPGVLLKKGSEGTHVKTLQKAIKVKVDGDFGTATETAVKKIQKAKKLKVDGIVGKATWGAIF